MLKDLLKHPIKFLFARVLQFIGNLCKMFCLLHFKFWPNARFTLPSYVPPLWTPKKSKRIARIVWQTNYTKEVTLSVYINYWWNRLLTPTYTYRLLDDDDALAYIKQNCSSEVLDAYSQLQIGAAKADFWRVLAQLKEGGVYLDIDAAFCWSPERVIKSEQAELLIRMPDGSITNYYFACEAGHPLLAEIATQIQTNISQNTLDNVFDMTGPTVFDNAVKKVGAENLYVESLRMVCRQGVFTNKFLQYPNNLKAYWVNAQQEKTIVK